MANQIFTFMVKADELAFMNFLERYVFEVYPRRVPPDWRPFRASAKAWEQLPDEDVYLVASDIGPALVDKIKRGPDKGSWRVDEVRSPVIFWERSRLNADGELLSGQLWAWPGPSESRIEHDAEASVRRLRIGSHFSL